MWLMIVSGNRTYNVNILTDGATYLDKKLPKSRESEIKSHAQSEFDKQDPTVCSKCGGATGFVVTTGFGSGQSQRVLSCGECRTETPFKTPRLYGFEVGEAPNPVPALDRIIGREWNSPRGRRKITGFDIKTDRYTVTCEGLQFPFLIKPSDIEEEIRIDELQYLDKLSREATQRILKAICDEKLAEHNDIDGFGSDLSDMQQGKVKTTLGGLRRFDGKVISVRDKVRELVGNGAIISGSRFFIPGDNGYYTYRELTQTGMDYAAYLIGKRDTPVSLESLSARYIQYAIM